MFMHFYDWYHSTEICFSGSLTQTITKIGADYVSEWLGLIFHDIKVQTEIMTESLSLGNPTVTREDMYNMKTCKHGKYKI